MFCAQDILRSYNLYSRPVVREEKPVEDDELKINFGDGQSLMCSVNTISRFEGLKPMLANSADGAAASFKESLEREIDLPNFSSSIFRLVAALILEKEPFYEIVSEDSFDNPFLFEDISEMMSFFHPEKFNAKEKSCIDQIKEDQLPYMPYEVAQAVVKGYETMLINEPERFIDENNKQVIPVLLPIAQDVLFRAQFLDPDYCSEHFNTLREVKQELLSCNDMVSKLHQRFKLSQNTMEKALVEEQIRGFNLAIHSLQEQLAALQDKTKVDTLPMMATQRMAAQIHHANPKTREFAIRSKERLDAYVASIKEALIKCKADMTRTDLLDYLIGPKGFLFDEYRLEPMKSRSWRFEDIYNFEHPDVHDAAFGYRLNNDGPSALEDEIREDLSCRVDPSRIPKPIIKDNTITKPLTEKMKELQAELLPILKNWNNPEVVTPEIREKFWATLITFNEWDQLGITVKDLSLTEGFKPEEVGELTTIHGLLDLPGSSRKHKFWFKPRDFTFLISNYNNPRNPDKHSTKRYIANPREWGLENRNFQMINVRFVPAAAENIVMDDAVDLDEPNEGEE